MPSLFQSAFGNVIIIRFVIKFNPRSTFYRNGNGLWGNVTTVEQLFLLRFKRGIVFALIVEAISILAETASFLMKILVQNVKSRKAPGFRTVAHKTIVAFLSFYLRLWLPIHLKLLNPHQNLSVPRRPSKHSSEIPDFHSIPTTYSHYLLTSLNFSLTALPST